MGAVILTSDEGGFGIEHSVRAITEGASLLDCLEAGIQAVEDDPRARTVGYGGAPNAEGVMELDASIMDGTTRACGAVGALTGIRHPISVARKVMEILPHVFLVGSGANRFAEEVSAEKKDMLTDLSREHYQGWLGEQNIRSDRLSDTALVPHMDFTPKKNLSFGTVTFLMRDAGGRLAGGVSTSGWAYKYPGRLGDSPVIGAGLYVDNRYGAASCTHTGEMTVRSATAHSVVMHMRYGKSVREACELALDDLACLTGGYLGPVIVHAMDRDGNVCVMQLGETDGDKYWHWSDKEGKVSAPAPTIYQVGRPNRTSPEA